MNHFCIIVTEIPDRLTEGRKRFIAVSMWPGCLFTGWQTDCRMIKPGPGVGITFKVSLLVANHQPDPTFYDISIALQARDKLPKPCAYDRHPDSIHRNSFPIILTLGYCHSAALGTTGWDPGVTNSTGGRSVKKGNQVLFTPFEPLMWLSLQPTLSPSRRTYMLRPVWTGISVFLQSIDILNSLGKESQLC